ncbi:MAG: ribose transport system ATP-binding protein [Thermomicrobiales bacterium]|nr:ribose transport system ATP-binding protein [Thermomicrobiales bacterium]
MQSGEHPTTTGPDGGRSLTGASPPGGPASPPPVVEVSGVAKSYGAAAALRGVSLAVVPGEVHGLCGHNGAGKSTLVKILVGLVRPDGGELRVAGAPVALNGTQDAQRHGIAIVDQELSLLPELTVAENIALGNVAVPRLRLRRREHARARELLDRVGLEHVAPGQQLQELAIGERQLVEIARMLGRKANLLILDEPTATLTEAEIERVFAAIRTVVAQGASVIFVSHRLGEVLSLCHRVTVLRDGALVGTRSVETLSRTELVHMMIGDQQRVEAPPARAVGQKREGGLAIRGLRVGQRVEGFDLSAARGTIVGLAGQLGSGASEIMRAVAGLESDCAGDVSVHGRRVQLASPSASVRAGIHFVSNDRKGEGLLLNKPVEQNLLLTRLGAVSTGGVLRKRRMAREGRKLAELIQVESRRLSAPVRELSGGNQQKVLVGRCLDRPRLELLLLDEPTRGVDVGGRAEIHRLIRHAAASGATVVFASTELDEIIELSDVVVTLFAGRVVSCRDSNATTPAEVFRDMTHRDETVTA